MPEQNDQFEGSSGDGVRGSGLAVGKAEAVWEAEYEYFQSDNVENKKKGGGGSNDESNRIREEIMRQTSR
jgi:hypothetical protein